MSRKRNVTVAAVQMKCRHTCGRKYRKGRCACPGSGRKRSTDHPFAGTFERQYFCQERRYEYYEFAKEVNENDAVKHFSALAKELSVVIPVSFYEKM